MQGLDHDTPRPFDPLLTAVDPEEKTEDAVKRAPSRVRCKACLNVLTSNEHLTPIAGETCHFFTNPAGVGFDLQTYLHAEGVTVGGKATDYFSWFEGFAWQHGFCNRCHQHIGWYFSCEGSSGFYALIVDRMLLV